MRNIKLAVLLIAIAGLFVLTKYGKRLDIKQSLPALGFSTIKKTADAETFTQEWFTQEADALNKIDSNPIATEKRLKDRAAKFTDADRAMLTASVINADGDENDRMLGMYLLSLDTKAPNEIFIKIANMNDPIYKVEIAMEHSREEFHLALVQSLAIHALDILQTRALQQPGLIVQLQNIARQAPNRLVADTAHSMVSSVTRNERLIVEAQ